MKLKWINDHSVFVELTRAKMAGSVMKQMGKIPAANYTVVPCGEFLEKRQKSLISGEGQMEGIGAKNSEANGSGPKKQKIEKFV